MKSYAHIAQKLFGEPLLITPQRHAALCQLLEARLASGADLASDVDDRSSRPNLGLARGRGRRPAALPGRRIHDDNPDLEGSDDDSSPSGQCDSNSAIQRAGNVGIIPVHGTLVMHGEDLAMSECGCAMDELSMKIDQAAGDARIDTVVFDFRTPGGSVTGIPEAGRKIASLGNRKETIAFTGSECCSGGIWLAEQCRQFYGTQSSRIGSVGVYCMLLDVSMALKDQGIKVNAISAAKYKLLGASFKPLAGDEREILQAGVDKIYAQFKDSMETHRVVDDKNFGNGLVFDGEEACEMGFTDGVVESLEEVLEQL